MLPGWIRWWIGLSLVGGAVVALPDSDQRVVSISATHGPSPLDALGLLLVLAGLAVFVAGVARGRRRVRERATAPRVAGLVALLAAGAALIGWSAGTDTGRWWLLGIAVAVTGQARLAWWAR